MACSSINDEAFLSSVLAHIDCQAQTIGDGGYHALSQSGSTGAALLISALTIFIALTGYRLLLGERFGTREIVMAAVKIGMALVLATSWPAVKTVLYNVVMHGPSQLAQQIGDSTAIPGLSGDLVDRLQVVDWELDELDQRGSGVVSPDTAGQTATGTQRRIDTPRDLSWLGLARLAFLSATIAAIALTRFAGGILLALAPIFALLLLFDTARGLFIGWLRGLIASTLGSVLVTISLGVELALIEPWVATLVATRRAEIATPSAPIQLLVLSLVFAAAMAGLLYLAFRVAQGLASQAVAAVGEPAAAPSNSGFLRPAQLQTAGVQGGRTSEAAHSRAVAVADAVAKSAEARSGERSISVMTQRNQGASTGPAGHTAPPPLGQSFRRRTQNRASASMARRNQT